MILIVKQNFLVESAVKHCMRNVWLEWEIISGETGILEINTVHVTKVAIYKIVKWNFPDVEKNFQIRHTGENFW